MDRRPGSDGDGERGWGVGEVQSRAAALRALLHDTRVVGVALATPPHRVADPRPRPPGCNRFHTVGPYPSLGGAALGSPRLRRWLPSRVLALASRFAYLVRLSLRDSPIWFGALCANRLSGSGLASRIAYLVRLSLSESPSGSGSRLANRLSGSGSRFAIRLSGRLSLRDSPRVGVVGCDAAVRGPKAL